MITSIPHQAAISLSLFALSILLIGCEEEQQTRSVRAVVDASVVVESNVPTRGPEQLQADLEVYRRRIIKLVDARPGMVVADIGSSYGYYVDALAPILGSEGKYYATDIDPEVIEHLQKYRKIVPILVPRLANAPRHTGLDELDAESVDVILMIDSVVFERPATAEADRDDVRYLERFARIMKPGGRFIHHAAWLASGHRDKEQVVALFHKAGFSGEHDDIALPASIPDRVLQPDGTPADRGFLLVFRR